MDDISIDRLIIDIPGLSPQQGAALARQIGEQLAASTVGAGEFQTLTITLDDGEAAQAPPGSAARQGRLASSIAAALLRQIG
jgi:hypothetical protein